jgi:SAM-dependent methyltransferase
VSPPSNGDKIWRDLHALQTTLCWCLELPLYYASPTWLGAQSVLDVGAGHGDYLRALAERFPGTSYLGVDIVPAYIEAAKRETTVSNVRFELGNVMDLRGQYDFVIARLLLQHLVDVPRAVASMLRAVVPGGSLLLIDALDEYRAFHPPLQEFTRFFELYANRERGQGRERNVLSRIPQIIAGMQGVTVGAQRDLLIPSTMPGHFDVFRAVYSRIIDLLAPDLEAECDVAAVRREWANWCRDERAYAQVGLRLIRLDRE